MVQPLQTVEKVVREVLLRITEQRERAAGQGGGSPCTSLHPLCPPPRSPPPASMPPPSSRGPQPTWTSTWPQRTAAWSSPPRNPSEEQAHGVELLVADLVAEGGLEGGQRILGLQNLVLCGVATALESLCLEWDETSLASSFASSGSGTRQLGLVVLLFEEIREHVL